MKYLNLLFMTLLSFISMFILMYIMVNSFANVYVNLNQFYMAGIMTMPMLIIELILMRSMYKDKRLNCIILAISALTFIALIIFMRKQTGIDDKQFLRSMIPHHAGAILMCEHAIITDPEIQKLCTLIIEAQQSEIAFMKEKLSSIS